ncbi:MAG: ABC transporter permease [Thermaerobacter sp.]|nr:ABC transporter permease [Thermaerobacter sp.]
MSRPQWQSTTWVVVLLNVALLVILAVINPMFFAYNNLITFIVDAAPLTMVALAQTVIILTGGIDLSLGPLLGLVNVIAASVLVPLGLSGLFVSLLSGVLAGLVTGAIIALGRLQPIIVTLAMSSVWSGLALLIMPQPGGGAPQWFILGTTGFFGAVPMILVLLVVVAILLWYGFSNTRYGAHVLAIGANERGAMYSGVSPAKVKVLTYTLAGGLTAVGALILTGSAASGDPTIGPAYTLTSIAAVVLGGTQLSGGKGSIWHTLGGVLILELLTQMIFYLGISSFYQNLIEGLVLIVAMGVGPVKNLPIFHSEKRVSDAISSGA